MLVSPPKNGIAADAPQSRAGSRSIGFRSFGPDGQVPGGSYDDQAVQTAMEACEDQLPTQLADQRDETAGEQQSRPDEAEGAGGLRQFGDLFERLFPVGFLGRFQHGREPR